MTDPILAFLIADSPLKDVIAIRPDDAIPKENVSSAYEGAIDIDGREVTLQIVLSANFPLVKPGFYLKDPYSLGFIPHVQKDGYVCYTSDEGLILDLDNPTGIIDFFLGRVIQILTDGKRGTNRHDFYEEFESYWINRDGCLECLSFVSITPFVKTIRVAYSPELRKLILGDTVGSITLGIRRYFNGKVSIEGSKSGIYIPLRAPVLPPPPHDFWSAKDLRRIIFDNLSGSNSKRLRDILKRKRIGKNETEIVVISMPLDKNKTRHAVVAVRFAQFCALNGRHNQKAFCHPLYQIDAQFEMTPCLCRRFDMDYILPRAGALPTLLSKKVALIGCGSVGGFIAFELARAGVGHLTVVDNDNLSPENIYRHALGADRLYEIIDKDGEKRYRPMPKVQGLRAELEAKYPYITVKAFELAIQDLIKDKILDLKSFDLVVVALGNPTVELYLNRYLHSDPAFPPAIFAWNEPLGIGGHALLTHNNGRSGCYECLHRDPQQPLWNKASFAAPVQPKPFARTVAGCGSVFTPYGGTDSVQTAILATRLGVKVLLGEEEDNPVISWKGDGHLFKQEYKTSPRYDLSVEELFASRYSYKTDGCPVCGHRASNDTSPK